jgi:hypothetical protein
VHFAETTQQRLQAPRQPLPAQPGRPQRDDDDDERHGPHHLFVFVAPQAGWRHGQVTERRPKRAFAHAMPGLVAAGYPEATGMRVVLDQLHTPKIASR